jgi:hypothetical protein
VPIHHVSEARHLGFTQIVKELAEQCIIYFGEEIRKAKSGIANGSCCACVKLNAPATDGYPDYRFGNSQARHLDYDVVDHGGLFNPDNHAERVAHAAAGAGMYGDHLFVELPPCTIGNNSCAQWCNQNIPNIHVWYLYYDTKAMEVAHSQGTEYQRDLLTQALWGA